MTTTVGVPPGVTASGYRARPPFDPLSIPWQSAFWASDPAWTPPAGGGLVSSWRDAGTSAVNADQATPANQPTYRTAGVNAKPSVEFGGTHLLRSAAFGSPIAVPRTVVVVSRVTALVNGRYQFSGLTSSTRSGVLSSSTGKWAMYAGTVLPSTVDIDTAAHFVLAYFNGASSTLTLDKTQIVAGGAGVQNLTGVVLGSTDNLTTAAFTGDLCFAAVIPGALTVQQIANLETWAKTFYGVPIP